MSVVTRMSDKSDIVRRAAIAGMPVLLLSVWSIPARATTVTLNDSNATAVIDTTGPSAGFHSLTVDGVEQARQQWFYYRLGSSGALQPISSLAQTFINVPASQGGTEPDNQMQVTYSGFQDTVHDTGPFSISVKYTLTGAPIGGANVNEDISLNNDSASNSGVTLPINFFQYNHFALDNNDTQDRVTITDGNTATQTLDGGAVTSLETAALKQPDFYEPALSPTLLTEFANPAFGHLAYSDPTQVHSAGPGAATWAFEWDPTIAAGSSFGISKVRSITDVPEPTVAIGAFAAVTAWFARRPRRESSK